MTKSLISGGVAIYAIDNTRACVSVNAIFTAGTAWEGSAGAENERILWGD